VPPAPGIPPRDSPRRLGARAAVWARAHRKLTIAGAALLLAIVIYPFAVGALVAGIVAKRASARLGRAVSVERGRAGLTRVVLDHFAVAGTPGGRPLVSIGRVSIPFSVAFGMRGPVVLSGLHVYAVRGGPEDNVSALLEHLRGRPGAAKVEPGGPAAPEEGAKPPEAAAAPARLPDIEIERGALDARDDKTHLSVHIASFDGELRPGQRLGFRLRGVRGLLALGGEGAGPQFGADELDLQSPLEGMHPTGVPSLRVAGGEASPLPSLALTGIAGVIAPPPVGVGGPASGLVIDLRGSYGGAREALWTAKGRAEPDKLTGTLALRAEQFSLGRIADVLPASVLAPENTTLDAALDIGWAGDAIRFGGELAVVGLSMKHESLAADPVENMSLALSLRGTAFPSARRLELERAEARIRDVTARVSGHVALPAGKFRFKNGRELSVVPDIELALTVPKVACAKLLTSIPPALIPRLQGFVLQGTFGADVGAKIDFAHLDALDLTGKVAIDGCKVLKAPPEVLALAEPTSIVVNVEVPKPLGAPSANEPDLLPVVVGPDNPDFVPYDQISPYLVSSIMTTEDNGFFKHRGWVSSEFKSALRRNLERGGFRLGASSITMQMTKNVLLTKDKTLSRKFQELFLVWYLEQVLPKERILELYFNAIEFGPRIYGIGAATRHYFGKKPSELTPLEAAFFSSILPSPKRRYIQYCHGSLLPQWDKYVHRILAKVHERGRITDEEYETYANQTLTFDRAEATFTEKQCLEWVKSMAPKAGPEAPPDLEDAEGDTEAGGWPQKRLRKLFSRATARRETPTPKSAARAQ
jgi:hypothetical protein